MPIRAEELTTVGVMMGASFLIGTFAQFLKQKTDVPASVTTNNYFWLSVAGGFSAMVIIGLLSEYSTISPAFLLSVAGIAGWAGVSLLAKLSTLASSVIVSVIEKRFGIKVDEKKPEPGGGDKNNDGVSTIGSQSEGKPDDPKQRNSDSSNPS